MDVLWDTFREWYQRKQSKWTNVKQLPRILRNIYLWRVYESVARNFWGSGMVFYIFFSKNPSKLNNYFGKKAYMLIQMFPNAVHLVRNPLHEKGEEVSKKPIFCVT